MSKPKKNHKVALKYLDDFLQMFISPLTWLFSLFFPRPFIFPDHIFCLKDKIKLILHSMLTNWNLNKNLKLKKKKNAKKDQTRHTLTIYFF